MSEYLPKEDVWVTQTKLPARVRALCKRVGFDECAVINEDLDDDAKRDAIVHEVEHIRRGDLGSEHFVFELEARKA